LAGLVTTPQVNTKGVISLIKQIHGKNVTLVNKSTLSDMILLAQLLSGIVDESEALFEVIKNYHGFLNHFYYTFAVPCNEHDLVRLFQDFPVQLLVKETKIRGVNLVLITANLRDWKIILTNVVNDTTIKIKDTFITLGLGKVLR